MFPHANVVNRYVSAVADMSNIGYGLTGGTINVGYDFIPHKLHGKIGGAAAISNITPSGGGNFMGWEVNGNLAYDLGPFMSIEAHGAYMGLGNFYDSKRVNGNSNERPVNPWMFFVAMRWLIF